VFVKTKRGADRLATRLTKQKMSADAIHGDLKQSRRDRVIAAFRDKKHRILVATDVAARGLDIPHIEHVINYDLPHAPEDFIHRIGRTARAGAQGSAISFVSPEDAGKWREIHRLMNPNEAPLPHPGRSHPQPNKNYKGRRPFRSRHQGHSAPRAAQA
jgi:superfamily II DNA/RNA helicase